MGKKAGRLRFQWATVPLRFSGDGKEQNGCRSTSGFLWWYQFVRKTHGCGDQAADGGVLLLAVAHGLLAVKVLRRRDADDDWWRACGSMPWSSWGCWTAPGWFLAGESKERPAAEALFWFGQQRRCRAKEGARLGAGRLVEGSSRGREGLGSRVYRIKRSGGGTGRRGNVGH
jgi:hypothetical protein